VKSLNLLPNVMAREQALRAGAFEAIFIREGKAMEGAGSNLFAVFGKKVITPPAGPYILSGITREVLIQVGKKNGLEMVEKEIKLQSLDAADELFLTGTTVEVLPIIRLDGKPVGAATPGKVTQFLYESFKQSIRER
jgi:D-alanine transaminase